MRSFFFLISVALLCAQEKPLTQLPYTPSLDPVFMDKVADPCVDFYRYACGNWNKLNPIPPDQPRWDVYSKLEEENERYLWGILELAAQQHDSRTANEQKIGDYFASCMNEPVIEALGAKPLEEGLARVAKLNSIREIASYVAEQHQSGMDDNVLLHFGSQVNYDDSSMMMAWTGAGGLGLPDRDYYTKTDRKSVQIRRRYVMHVAEMLQLAGEDAATARADAEVVLKIESELARASLTRVEYRNPYNLKHHFSKQRLSRLAPRFDWAAFFQGSGAPEFEEINVVEPSFLLALNRMLGEYGLAAWRAYFRWHLVHSASSVLAARFESSDFNFYAKYLRGVKEAPPRWKKCTRMVDAHLGDALGEVFVARTFSADTKAATLRMVEQIEAEMQGDIENLNWMGPATKREALKKLHTIVNKIGYPDRWRDYSALEIRAGDLFGNSQRARAFEEKRTVAKIGRPVDRKEWFMTPPTVNAYYEPQTNDINFPAGVLQPPLYDPKMDDAPNYGNTGATIGHELTHGFDDEGRKFDAQGNLKDWWAPHDAKAFETRAACTRNQYAGYVVVDGIHINSRLTLGEDVADLGGTLMAYLAWKHATARQQLESRDGLTPDQRFFVGMAQWACGEERPENKRLNATVDPHSPNEFRVNGVVSNMPEFGEAFGCAPGQPMMRVKACRVW